jgi:uncharacterized protein (TIGR02996 family)
MTPEEALLQAIRDDIDDDLPRLAYADWREEQGDRERAEFIRVECRLARMSADDPERRALFRRDLALLVAHKDEWFGPGREAWYRWDCRRGFLDEIRAEAAVFLQHAPALWTRNALRHLEITLKSAEAARLGGSPYLEGVRCLVVHPFDIHNQADGDLFLGALAGSPHIRFLEKLHLPVLRGGPRGAFALAESEYLGNLRSLNLRGHLIRHTGLIALLESPRLPCLEVLFLSGYRSSDQAMTMPNIESEGAVRLARCPGAARLRSLVLFQNRLNDEALHALANSPYLDGLTSLGLDLHENSDAAVAAIHERFGTRLRQRFWD